MRGRTVVAITALLVAAFLPVELRAAPIAQWLAPWQTVFDVPDFSGGASAARCFGIGCTANGQNISLGAANEALPGTSAYAAATVAASSPFLIDANASGQAIFSREFSLTGSDTGWIVTFSGSYAANGTASGASVNSNVSLAAVASVRRQPIITSPTLGGLALNYTKTLDATVADPSTLNVPVTPFGAKSAQLDNGTYWVFGQVQATTHVDSALFSSGIGNGGIGATYTLNATPAPPLPGAIPEPSAMILIGSGLIAAGLCRKQRRAVARKVMPSTYCKRGGE
jgi:hypothetical protein